VTPRSLKRFWDWKSGTLIAVTVLLTCLGLVVLAGSAGDPGTSRPWLKQLVWLCIGMIVAAAVMLIHYRILLGQAYLFYGLILACLLLTEQFGREVYGAKSWLVLPVLHLRFQPSEFSKLAVILVLARVLAAKEGAIAGLREMLGVLVLVAVPALLILRQPDLGTMMVLMPITLGMLYLGGMSWVYGVLILAPLAGFLRLAPGTWPFLLWALGLVGIVVLMRRAKLPGLDRLIFLAGYIGLYVSMQRLWNLLKPHQQSRFRVFWDPSYDPDGAGYNLLQSKIAIGSGGFFGKGFGQGTQSRLQFLPESHTDFTFAVLAEDWGFLGCAVFFGLFLTLIYLCFEIARESRSHDGALLASGVGVYFVTHFAINVGMAMGMLPVAGLPLSFLSYGGSHLLACMIGVGIVLNVKLWRFH